ncbi:hypothetical protein D3C86_1363720 [compost metagenome]
MIIVEIDLHRGVEEAGAQQGLEGIGLHCIGHAADIVAYQQFVPPFTGKHRKMIEPERQQRLMSRIVAVGHHQQTTLDLQAAIVAETLVHRQATRDIPSRGDRIATRTVAAPDGIEGIPGQFVRQCVDWRGQRRCLANRSHQVLARRLPGCRGKRERCRAIAEAGEHGSGLHFAHRLVQCEGGGSQLKRLQANQGKQ